MIQLCQMELRHRPVGDCGREWVNEKDVLENQRLTID